MTGDAKNPRAMTDDERTAFDELYSSCYSAVLSHIRRRIGGGDAEDCASDTFMRASRHMDEFMRLRPEERLKLLYSYANSVCAEYRRKSARRNTVTFTDAEADGGTSLAEDIPDGGDVQTELVDREMKTALVREIKRLDPVKRRAILLRYAKGMKSDEIAAEMNMNPSTLRSLMQRTLAELREKLEDYDV